MEHAESVDQQEIPPPSPVTYEVTWRSNNGEPRVEIVEAHAVWRPGNRFDFRGENDVLLLSAHADDVVSVRAISDA